MSLNVPGILVGWLQNIKANLPLSMKCPLKIIETLAPGFQSTAA
ncbi:hypothetical protein C4J95_4112 [Pseudomonas orientalis]|nr:hypothetical protein C4J97_4221 [Pseudomonas orientalis]AZE96178.1 hypothetical protein C4J96_4089 [Pseudomonas orientalis]AZF01547.1 hypothetical protein C4J95_4112 [Pseudomonas orientalis]